MQRGGNLPIRFTGNTAVIVREFFIVEQVWLYTVEVNESMVMSRLRGFAGKTIYLSHTTLSPDSTVCKTQVLEWAQGVDVDVGCTCPTLQACIIVALDPNEYCSRVDVHRPLHFVQPAHNGT